MYKTLKDLQVLFSIENPHSVDSHFSAITEDEGQIEKEIQSYLNAHPSVKHFVVIDNGENNALAKAFPNRFFSWKTEREQSGWSRRERIIDTAYEKILEQLDYQFEERAYQEPRRPLYTRKRANQ